MQCIFATLMRARYNTAFTGGQTYWKVPFVLRHRIVNFWIQSHVSRYEGYTILDVCVDICGFCISGNPGDHSQSDENKLSRTRCVNLLVRSVVLVQSMFVRSSWYNFVFWYLIFVVSFGTCTGLSGDGTQTSPWCLSGSREVRSTFANTVCTVRWAP